MSRSQGAANGGWQQRRPVAEPDPRTGRPTQPGTHPAQAPTHAEQPQAPAGQQGYYYPQAAQPAQAPPPQQGRSGLSSFEPAGQPVHDFDHYPATQPPHAPQQSY